MTLGQITKEAKNKSETIKRQKLRDKDFKKFSYLYLPKKQKKK